MYHFFDRKETVPKETPDLFLRNHVPVRILHRSLKLTILRSRNENYRINSFRSQWSFMLVKSLRQ